jgi:hypothetical protein
MTIRQSSSQLGLHEFLIRETSLWQCELRLLQCWLYCGFAWLSFTFCRVNSFFDRLIFASGRAAKLWTKWTLPLMDWTKQNYDIFEEEATCPHRSSFKNRLWAESDMRPEPRRWPLPLHHLVSFSTVIWHVSPVWRRHLVFPSQKRPAKEMSAAAVASAM